MTEGRRLPVSIYFPQRAIRDCLVGGELDLDLLGNDRDRLDEGASRHVVEIPPTSIISAETTLLKLMQWARGSGYFCLLVLEGDRWSGVVTPDDLMSPPARMCFLAMILELEATATNLCRLFPEQSFSALPEPRRAKATKPNPGGDSSR